MVFLSNQFICFPPTRKDQKQTIFFLRCHRQTFSQDMFKDVFNCETGMCGTVTCRSMPTVAYRVQTDGIIISN